MAAGTSDSVVLSATACGAASCRRIAPRAIPARFYTEKPVIFTPRMICSRNRRKAMKMGID